MKHLIPCLPLLLMLISGLTQIRNIIEAQILIFIPTQQKESIMLPVIDTNGCEAKSEIIYFYMTGLDSNLPQTGVKIYPNPTNGVLTVQLNQLPEKKASCRYMV
ncbi:MAG: hypothetical protein R3B93_20820 [Bacteroidia bacterium]